MKASRAIRVGFLERTTQLCVHGVVNGTISITWQVLILCVLNLFIRLTFSTDSTTLFRLSYAYF